MSTPVRPSSEFLDRVLQNAHDRCHFVGMGGTGMSALAHLRAMAGCAVSGSDRAFDQGKLADEQARSRTLGIQIFPQDGSGVAGAAVLIVSTAVEPTIPDVRAAIEAGIPIAHRAEWLAAHVRAQRTIAVTGTSGKSTVVAMIFEALSGAGLDPAVITGGDLRCLQDAGQRGNCHPGQGPLVIEADESDKSLVHYAPEIAVILNLQRDHDEPEEIAKAFVRFAAQSRQVLVGGDDPRLPALLPSARAFGLSAACLDHAEQIELGRDGSTFQFAGVRVEIPVPGRHNVENAIAALAACRAIGADLARAAAALRHYRGVARRFEVIGTPRGIEVVDDFAHNPAKVAAALATARARAPRVFAFFQPHGFAPTRFMRHDLVRAFRDGQRPGDRLYLGEIYYAGGTAQQDLSSRDLCADVIALGGEACALAARRDLAQAIRADARAGDCVLIMGARDPSLATFAREVAADLAEA